jgi:hypothetical protein
MTGIFIIIFIITAMSRANRPIPIDSRILLPVSNGVSINIGLNLYSLSF